MLATPVETVPRSADDAAVRRILQIVDEVHATEVIVGLPLALSGRHTTSTDDAVGFAQALADRTPSPVRLVDERLSSVSAQSALHTSGRRIKGSRPVIDQIAATIILQHALDVERSSETPPGTLVSPSIGTAT